MVNLHDTFNELSIVTKNRRAYVKERLQFSADRRDEDLKRIRSQFIIDLETVLFPLFSDLAMELAREGINYIPIEDLFCREHHFNTAMEKCFDLFAHFFEERGFKIVVNPKKMKDVSFVIMW